MTKTEIMEKIEEIIGNENAWVVLFYKGKDIGAIKLGDTNGISKEDILFKFDIRINKDGTFSLWMDNPYGYCYYTFDKCTIETL